VRARDEYALVQLTVAHVEAIARQVEQAELDEEFHRVADSRWASVLASGKTVPWDKARAYLEARARGARARRPAARKLDRR
jgi:UDP-N-acetylglucosamine 2-epimerase